MDQLFIKKIYDVVEANNGLFIAAGLEPIRTMDLWRGQLLNPIQFEYFPTPALFLNYRVRWEKVGGKKYTGYGTLEAHYAIDNPFTQTASFITNNEEGLKQVFSTNIVRALLDDLESANTKKLTRGDERPVDTGVICYHILEYSFEYYDPAPSGTPYVNINDGNVEIIGKQLVKQITND